MEQPETILQFRRRESNPDEVDRLVGNDRSYVQAVRANFHQQAAGAHLVKAVRELAYSDRPITDAALRSLVADYEHLARGYSLRNAGSSTCDCSADRDWHFRGRCTGCGAGLSPEFLKYRRDVEGGGVA